MESSDSNSDIKIIWEWQSNSDPWSKVQPQQEIQWTPYSSDENELIEKAFQNKQEEIELNNYIISLKDMLQKNKQNAFKQRQIRRRQYSKDNEDIIMNFREYRFFGAETPKTYNKAFGSLKDFIWFFENRGPEIKEFVTLFSEIEDDDDIDELNQEILPVLMDSITKESAKDSNETTKENLAAQLNLFNKSVSSFKDFYGMIFKSYTMDGFLYRNLNKYLRNEDWVQLDNLLQYAFCLCKAFSFEFSSGSKFMDSNEDYCVLFRGAMLDETSLSLYNKERMPYFSWNAMTSTTKKRRIAERFMQQKIDPKKTPVIFLIEVPSNIEELKSCNIIDAKPFSYFPGEEEIILSPGSIFQLLNVSQKNKQNQVEIKLRLATDAQGLAHKGHVMHGAMQAEISKTGEKAIIAGLQNRDFLETINLFWHNKLIEEFEVLYCQIDKELFEKLIKVLETIPSLQKFKIILLMNLETALDQGIIQEQNKKNFKNFTMIFISPHGRANIIWEPENKTESLEFKGFNQTTDEIMQSFSSKCIQYLSTLTSLSLDFGGCRLITDEGLRVLCTKGFKYLSKITSLTIDFRACKKITDVGIKSFSCEGLKNLNTLTNLTLNFGGCDLITDEGLKVLCFEGISNLSELTSLTLNLQLCDKITKEMLINLSSKEYKHPNAMMKLTADFASFDEFSSTRQKADLQYNTYGGYEEVFSGYFPNFADNQNPSYNLHSGKKVGGVSIKKIHQTNPPRKHNQQRQYFTEFGVPVFRVDDKFVSKLKQDILPDPDSSLKGFIQDFQPIPLPPPALALSFLDYIPNQGLELLASEGLKHLPLPALTLKFERYHLEDEGLKILSSQGIKYIQTLSTLNLHFKPSQSLTDEGILSLSSEALKHLPSLTKLSLEFHSSKITDQGLKILSLEGLQNLHNLKNLILVFEKSESITDDGLEFLSSGGIKHLSSLTNLTLNFRDCKKITDQGLHSLGSRLPPSLFNLTLDFYGWMITDKGLKGLSLEGIKHLVSLTTLTLDFGETQGITDEGLRILGSEGISNLLALTDLSLGFEGCQEVSTEGIKSLISPNVIKSESFETLSMNFKGCEKIHEHILFDICFQIHNLSNLKALNLRVDSVAEISSETYKDLAKLYKYFGFFLNNQRV